MGVILKDGAEGAVVHRPLHVFWRDEHLVMREGLLARQLQDVGRQVLQNAGEENGCAPAQALDVGSFSQEAIHAANGELQLGSPGAGEGMLLTPASGPVSSFPRHCLLAFANQTSWIVLPAWASPDTSDFSCPLYSGAPAPRWSGSCLCDNSDFVMSLVSAGP